MSEVVRPERAAQTPSGTAQLPPRSTMPGPVDSAELLRGARWIEIRHNGEVYRLQATRLGKLILTK